MLLPKFQVTSVIIHCLTAGRKLSGLRRYLVAVECQDTTGDFFVLEEHVACDVVVSAKFASDGARIC